jgi:hypothetical protein
MTAYMLLTFAILNTAYMDNCSLTLQSCSGLRPFNCITSSEDGALICLPPSTILFTLSTKSHAVPFIMTSPNPFLSHLPSGSLAYEATRRGDLARLFDIFKMHPDLAVRITQVTLDENLDGPYQSGILAFAERYGTTPDTAPVEEEASRLELLVTRS